MNHKGGKKMDTPDIKQYYDQDPKNEWDRLTNNKMEFAVTIKAFDEFFPSPPATVLDIGGGPGRYSIALAEKGYTVTLADISQNSLVFAQKKAAEAKIPLEYVHTTCTDLPFPDNVFDVILVMGPLYHLRSKKERIKAISEAVRVLKPEELIFATFVTVYAPLRWAAKYDPEWVVTHLAECKKIIETGRASTESKQSFVDYAWFSHSWEIPSLMESAGLTTLEVIACEGIVSFIDEKINELTGDSWKKWVDINYTLAKDANVHETAEHLLYIGQKWI
ncbi:MAG: class I SAM-dependent methyltransferase [Candidatus Methanofastidiosia archaeon]